MALPKKFSKGPRADGGHARGKAFSRQSDLAFVVRIVAICLPVGLKATALVQVDQRAADLMWLERPVKRLTADAIRVEAGEGSPRFRLSGQQAKADQHLNEPLSPLQETVPPPASSARSTAPLAKRSLIFGVAAVIKDAHAAVDQASGLRASTTVVDRENGPTDGLGPEIEGEAKPVS